ncbi:inositol polyphosphate kinase kcs1, partial [Elasticomyces elasticus]
MQHSATDTNTKSEVTDAAHRYSSSTILDDDGSIDPAAEGGSSMRSAMQESERTERSVSHSRAHIDKSIEATVKKPEIGKHVRSRKASHMMGIFDSHSGSRRRPGQETDADRSDNSGQATQPGTPESPAVAVGDNSSDDYFATATKLSKQSALLDPNVQATDPEDISPGTNLVDDQIDQAFEEQTPRASFPIALLKQIEAAGNTGSSSRNQTTTSGGVVEDKTLCLPEAELKPVHDEDEEHIAAAVYYPHEGLSADEHLDHDDHDVSTASGRLRNTSSSLHSTNAPQARDLADVPDAQPRGEHIDISVESKYEKSVFHGVLKSATDAAEQDEDDAQTPRMPAIDEQTRSNAGMTSSSEIGSSDELTDLSRTEDGVATPVPTNDDTRNRAGTTAKPKTAVTLAPYKHQVGGHSTIFRFSRRAICKQLNNRENEFYERVEKSHTDMLKFLP